MLTESKLAQIDEILNKMKENGIGGGVIRIDGVLVKSTVALPDVLPMLISRATNVSDAMLAEVGDSQKEAEITIEAETLVVVRAGQHFFFGFAKNKEEKKTIIEYAKKLESALG